MQNQNPRPNTTWSNREAYLLALVCLLVGVLLGYLLRGSSPAVPATSVTTGSAPPASPSGTPDAASMPTAASLEPLAAPLLAAIKADPKNVDAMVQLGNLYYDHRVYPQAIEYYTRALDLKPGDVNVRTDLGTAYWYTGFPERAVAEYKKSLAVDPTHANTLFNMGVVQSEGLKDYSGAIATWKKLLDTNPQYPQRQRVLDLIAQARSKQP